MRTKHRRQTLDENNNNAIVADRESIELDDATVVVNVGDVVWLKHDAKNFLTTPFIIEHFNSEQMTTTFWES